jgi:dCTP deaminase
MMLSDKDIVLQLEKHGTEGSLGRLIDRFPNEGKADWSSLPLSDAKWNTADSPIQPASIDLFVGHIFIPGDSMRPPGGEERGHMSHTLRPGHSVVVSTYEQLNLPATLGGIVFPPSKLSSNGILVANLGHIDPGFVGHLRFTIINMGASDFYLERGTVAVGTLLLFELTSPSIAPYKTRHDDKGLKGEPDRKEIDALSKDFANIESRVVQITKRTVNKLYWRFSLLAVLIPVVIGIALAVWTIWYESGRSLSERIDKDDQSITDIKVSLAKIEGAAAPRSEIVNNELAQIRAELEKAERDLSVMRNQVASKSAENKKTP